MMRTGRNAMRSAGINARNGAPEMRFDAYARRQPVTESSYINRLANRTYRSTVKTLPATLPGPWSEGHEPSTKVRGPRTLSRGSCTASRGSSFAARASWTPNWGYWGWLLDMDRFGSSGGGLGLPGACSSAPDGDGWLEAAACDFVRMSWEVQTLPPLPTPFHCCHDV